MTVENLNYEYQETGSSLVHFLRPGVALVDAAAGFTEEYGPPQVWEDIAFQEWKDNGEKPEFADLVPRPEENGILVSSGEIIDEYVTGQHKYTHAMEYDGPNNKVGYWLSMAENFRQDLLDMIYDEKGGLNPEIVRYVRSLSSKGLRGEAPIAIAVEDLSDKDARAVTYTDPATGRTILGIDKRYYTDEKKDFIGVDDPRLVDLIEQDDMYHEIGHIMGIDTRSMSRSRAEITVATNMAEFYEERAEALKGTRQGSIYKALAEQAREYAEHFNWYNRLTSEITSPFEAKGFSQEEAESLLEQYAEEARLEGINTEAGVKDYISNKLEALTRENAETDEETADHEEDTAEHAEDQEAPEEAEGGE